MAKKKVADLAKLAAEKKATKAAEEEKKAKEAARVAEEKRIKDEKAAEEQRIKDEKAAKEQEIIKKAESQVNKDIISYNVDCSPIGLTLQSQAEDSAIYKLAMELKTARGTSLNPPAENTITPFCKEVALAN